MSTIPDASSTIVVEFKDGTFAVPRYWIRYINANTARYNKGHQVINMTLQEFRDSVNKWMADDTFRSAIRRSIRGI